MKYLPLLVFVVIVVLAFAWMGRARRRQAAGQVAQAERIEVGTEVMTTSGLYGTVVAKNDDGTVALSIAPGLEVKWELAALRDVASLPPNVGNGLRGASEAESPYDPPPGGGTERP
ncbi:preprotein translocase subunit YajC [Jatrophihabitans endophyticus]|uniref:preprotein translocase subunit YajC n=1 Tax=Jatrophihabitans endophyticus TaxID=1206085 RepID=UPI0019E1CE15|nr:preprotein translocase subunit YajC [Jatrophihabitans endophyticus]MBE7189042.1 preprotein translocase subunit YajC [Jatrophihabitans endophyticus]